MMELVHMTATYSNAVLVAILPQVSDFAKKLDLPVVQPITVSQVIEFRPSPYKDQIGGGLIISNGYLFGYFDGGVHNFRSPDNFFYEDDPVAHWRRYIGTENMTTNQALDLARKTLRKLGYDLKQLHVDVPPTHTQPPAVFRGYHIPQYLMQWDGPDEHDATGHDLSVHVMVTVNLEKKTINGMTITGGKLRRAPPKVAVEPELESDYQKRIHGEMLKPTNGPPRLLQTNTAGMY